MKTIKYLNKNYSDFRKSLEEYTKIYFPENYNDFSEAQPGSIFLNMISYIGDVTNFYLDSQIQENFLNLAKNKESLYNLSYIYGYRPKLSYASNCIIDIYQLIPSNNGSPDLSYSLLIPSNTKFSTNFNDTKFILINDIDFSLTSSLEISYYNEDFFLFKAQGQLISAEEKELKINFDTPTKFNSTQIIDEKILYVDRIIDENDDVWYEVPYLAQDTIDVPLNNPLSGSDGVKYVMGIKSVPKRFITRVKSDNALEIQFGSGVSSKNDEELIPNINNLNIGLTPNITSDINDYNKKSFLFTKSYGVAPLGELTIKYFTGGGVDSNVDSNTINIIDKTNSSNWFKFNPLDNGVKQIILDNIIVNNPSPSVGGKDGDTLEEIRLNSLYSFQSQNRAISDNDYKYLTLNLPNKYGKVAKAITLSSNNPFELDIYTLGYNNQKQLIPLNNTIKSNLSTYISQYKTATDKINIKDAFYINIGVNFQIHSDPTFNGNELILKCINEIKNHFNIDNWQINQPIIISEITSKLLSIQGIKSIPQIEIINFSEGEYSPYSYDINKATKNGIIYPSLDPSIFEIRFPNNDIKGIKL